jgi:hypothetical protein
MAEGEFVRRLGEAGYSPNNARGELLDLLACAGFLVHEGLVLTQRAHEVFLRTSGALRDIRAVTKRGEDGRQRAEMIRSRHVPLPCRGKVEPGDLRGSHRVERQGGDSPLRRFRERWLEDHPRGEGRRSGRVAHSARVGEAGRCRSPRRSSSYLAVAGLSTGQDLRVGTRGRQRLLVV